MRDNLNKPRHSGSERKNYNDSILPSDNDLLRREQKQRHDLQEKYFRSDVISLRLGQVFGLIYNLVLVYFVYDLIKTGNGSVGMKIFFLNVILIGFVALVVGRGNRKFGPKRHGHHFRNRNRGNNSNRGNR
jgi:hypothetical protein